VLRVPYGKYRLLMQPNSFFLSPPLILSHWQPDPAVVIASTLLTTHDAGAGNLAKVFLCQAEGYVARRAAESSNVQTEEPLASHRGLPEHPHSFPLIDSASKAHAGAGALLGALPSRSLCQQGVLSG
jgi:hypothetical protein